MVKSRRRAGAAQRVGPYTREREKERGERGGRRGRRGSREGDRETVTDRRRWCQFDAQIETKTDSGRVLQDSALF